MSVVQETVNVEPNTRAAGKALAKVILDVRRAGGGGLAVLLSAVPDLIPLFQSIPAIPSEASDNPEAEVETAFLVGMDIYHSLTTKI